LILTRPKFAVQTGMELFSKSSLEINVPQLL